MTGSDGPEGGSSPDNHERHDGPGAGVDVIQEFIERYRREFDYYEQVSRLAAQITERHLHSAGIHAIVTARAKSSRSLEAKLRKRHAENSFSSVDSIYSSIHDLAGMRVALYFPAELTEVDKSIRTSYDLIQAPKRFPDPTLTAPYPKKFSGYAAVHYRARLKPSILSEAQARYADATIEIQVASVLMHAWAEVEHDLVYKPLQGALSEDEYAILDELNGLVMAGEIALERLQRATKSRVSTRGRVFQTHFDLAAYVLDHARLSFGSELDDAALGRIDLLFRLIQKVDLHTPEKLQPYLAKVNADTEKRPVSDQIVDHLLTENPARYAIFENIRRDDEQSKSHRSNDALDRDAALANFLAKWIALEKVMSSNRTPDGGYVASFRDLLRRIEASDQALSQELERVRRFRNALVHGDGDEASADDLRAGAEILDRILLLLRPSQRD